MDVKPVRHLAVCALAVNIKICVAGVRSAEFVLFGFNPTGTLDPDPLVFRDFAFTFGVFLMVVEVLRLGALVQDRRVFAEGCEAVGERHATNCFEEFFKMVSLLVAFLD